MVALIAHHELPGSAFAALASGVADPGVVRGLHEAQLSKHTMLLYAISKGAHGTGPGPSAFRTGFDLLSRVQRIDPVGAAWLLGLPHLGGWIHDCLIRMERREEPDLPYLACAAASAAVRAGIPFALDVPVRDNFIPLPGLGSLHIVGESGLVRLRCDGERVTVDGHFAADRTTLVPDDGSSEPVAHWSGTPVVQAVADGLGWNVLLETADLYLDRYAQPMAVKLSPGDIDRWRQRIRSAWEILVRHHRSSAEPIAAGVSVVIPLMPYSDNDQVSATSPAAFGAIATSWPPDAVTLAETFVHEFQHVKLCGLMDMIPLVKPSDARVYAPWRQDPRPVGGLLQGLYAHLQIARYWSVQQHVVRGSDDVLHAQASFARWRSTIGITARTLQESCCLTVEGEWFVDMIRQEGEVLEAEYLPDVPRQIAEEIARDHWLTWQARHVAVDPDGVTSLAAAYRRGTPFREHPSVRTWVTEDTRKIASDKRSRLLNLRYLSPARHREVRSEGFIELSEADDHLISGRTNAAIQAYRKQITSVADPPPDTWVGLALALHRLESSALSASRTANLALIIEVHAELVRTRPGERIDPLELASWFA